MIINLTHDLLFFRCSPTLLLPEVLRGLKDNIMHFYVKLISALSPFIEYKMLVKMFLKFRPSMPTFERTIINEVDH